MKNTMILKNEDTWTNGQNVGDIRRWSIDEEKGLREFKDMKKDIGRWNKVAKQLGLHNPELMERYKDLSYGSENHLKGFINRIITQVKAGNIKVEQIGLIESMDDGSRGTCSTMQMHLLDVDGVLLDVAQIHTNQFYYM